MTKEFSYNLIVEDNGKTMNVNETNVRKGYRKSMYSTEAAALKGLNNEMKFRKAFGNKIVSWTLTRNNVVIDAMN